MSVSPPREDVEHGGPSPDNSEHMDRGDPEAQARELAYEFEVKEQDRWLPIANGWFFCVIHAYSSYDLRVSVFRRCTMIEEPEFVASDIGTREITGLIIMPTICAGILTFTLYGHIFSSQSELTMSRNSPQSISPQRGSRHNSLVSDANIRNFAPVARIMKTALPDNAKIAKEAKECMQECVSEFISFITSEASEKCQQEKRKTVNGEDILFAMTSLGFENYAEALKIYLSKYRETQSARGENQQRPGSSYGSAGAQPGPSGSVGSGPNASSSSTAYHPQSGEGVNNILGASHGLESTEQDTTPYGNVYPSGSGNNGVGGEPY